MKKRHVFIVAVLVYVIGKLMGTPDYTSAPQLDTPQSKPLAEQKKSKPAIGQIKPSSVEDTAPNTRIAPQSNSPPATAAAETNFVTGTRVAFRDGPSTVHAIIDRFDNGREVGVLQHDGDWSKVRDALTQREGWLATRFLSAEKPAAKAESEKRAPAESKPEIRQPDTIPESVIVQRIIDDSIAGYPSSCPCPYNVDRGGRRCGKRSAYSKPGGYDPICYAGDVSKSMIEAFASR